MKKKMGFTLVEIMIVVLIIGLLAAIAIPSFVKARERSRTSACINNLRQIDGAKEQYAMENSKDSSTTPTTTDLAVYIKNGVPSCPAGSTAYSINAIGTNPQCAVNPTDHTL